VRALVFDLGNTLVRTADLIEATYREVFREHGLPLEVVGRFKEFAGRPKHFLFAEAIGPVPGRDARVRACMADFEARLVEAASRVEEIAGASAALAALGAAGWRIATASGFPRAVGRALLARFGWRYPVVCEEDVAEHRPAPDPVLEACARLEVAPAETVVVGDTPQDVRSARAAGAVCVAVASGRFSRAELAAHAPRAVLGSVAELPALLAAEPALRLAAAPR